VHHRRAFRSGEPPPAGAARSDIADDPGRQKPCPRAVAMPRADPRARTEAGGGGRQQEVRGTAHQRVVGRQERLVVGHQVALPHPQPDLGAAGDEGPECAQEGRLLDDDHVARIDEGIDDVGKRVTAAAGEGNVLCRHADARLGAEARGDVVAQGGKALDWIEQRRWYHTTSSHTIARSRAYFQRRGAVAIFLSRFLFSALGGTINIVAGADAYPYPRFLLYDAIGETIGAIIPLSLGYVFGASWEDIGDLLSTSSGFVLALLFTCFLTIRLIRMVQRPKALASKQNNQLAPQQQSIIPKTTVKSRYGWD